MAVVQIWYFIDTFGYFLGRIFVRQLKILIHKISDITQIRKPWFRNKGQTMI